MRRSRQSNRVRTLTKLLRSKYESGQHAATQDGGKSGRGTDRQPEYLATVGLQQDVLHAETDGSKPDREQQARRAAVMRNSRQHSRNAGRARSGAVSAGLRALLLPQGYDV